jgi:hypothetical protein
MNFLTSEYWLHLILTGKIRRIEVSETLSVVGDAHVRGFAPGSGPVCLEKVADVPQDQAGGGAAYARGRVRTLIQIPSLADVVRGGGGGGLVSRRLRLLLPAGLPLLLGGCLLPVAACR